MMHWTPGTLGTSCGGWGAGVGGEGEGESVLRLLARMRSAPAAPGNRQHFPGKAADFPPMRMALWVSSCGAVCRG